MRKSFFYLASLLFVLSMEAEASQSTLSQIKILKSDKAERIVLTRDGESAYHVFTLTQPNRLVIDFNETRLKADIHHLPIQGTPIQNVRVGWPKSDTLRLVFDLSSKPHFQTMMNHHELWIDLANPTGATAVSEGAKVEANRLLAQKKQEEERHVAELKKHQEAEKIAAAQKLEETKRLAEMKRQEEVHRILELQKQQEAKREAELKQEQETKRLLEMKKQEEANRLAEMKKQEEANRLAEIKKQEEASRLAELKKQEEANHLAELKKQEEANRLAEFKKQEAANHLAELKKQEEMNRQVEAKKQEVSSSPFQEIKSPLPVGNPSPALTASLSKSLNKKAEPRAFIDASNLPSKHDLIVVIDPGHGGKDPGAKGIRGLKEKELVLSISERLADLINRQPHMKALLTRKGDYYIGLRNRLHIARLDKADVFIAIHADAYIENDSNGASVYTLSSHGASSEAARWLAQRENVSELGEMNFGDLSDQSYALRSVLIDLAQTATKADSQRLGQDLLRSLGKVSKLHYNEVEQAPFMVLKSPDIPSALIETGYLSNPKDEEHLREKAYQEKLAQAIFEGVLQYAHQGLTS